MTKGRKRRKLSKKINNLKNKHDITREEAVKLHTENSPKIVHSKFTKIGMITATGMNSKEFKKYYKNF